MITVTYYLEVISSWCHWAEPAWAELKRRYAGRAEFDWKIAQMPESASLAAANKRVQNILNKTAEAWGHSADPAKFELPQERALHEALLQTDAHAQAALACGDYTVSLQALAALKAPVDAFFDTVMVNVEDRAMRTNRLGLLAQLHSAMNRIADLSKLN